MADNRTTSSKRRDVLLAARRPGAVVHGRSRKADRKRRRDFDRKRSGDE